MFVFSVGDGRLGFTDGAPYDAIHVGAAAPTVPKAVGTHNLPYMVLQSYPIYAYYCHISSQNLWYFLHNILKMEKKNLATVVKIDL